MRSNSPADIAGLGGEQLVQVVAGEPGVDDRGDSDRGDDDRGDSDHENEIQNGSVMMMLMMMIQMVTINDKIPSNRPRHMRAIAATH